MYNLLIALGISVASYLLLVLTPLSWLESILPAVVVVGVAFFFLARRTNRSVEALFMRSMKDIEAGKPELAIATLKEVYAFEKWQFLVKAQADAQIGSIYFLQRKFEEAEPYLEKAFIRHWVAQGMLACLYFRRHKLDEAKKVLDKAMVASRKEPLLYGLYAYLLDKAGRKDEAQAVLTQGVAAVPGNAPLKANLLALQNKQKMDMAPFGDAWYQFHQEPPPQARILQMQQQQLSRRGIRRRDAMG